MGLFQKGNTYGKLGGRPKNSKSLLPKIRDRVFNILSKRLLRKEEVDKISTEALLKFASNCLPKDMSLQVLRDPDITYVSNIPRPELENKVREGVIEYVPINKEGEEVAQQGSISGTPIESSS